MESRPKISVITPSKNGARFLRETIDSILQQTFTDYEHVLVDGVSTDNTIEILKDYKDIRWMSEPDRDADEAVYKALMMARGEYVMLSCISDGYLDRDWFGKCVEILDNEPEVSLVYGLAQRMTEDGKLGKIASSNLLNNPPPQKMDFFSFWLGTFALFSELTFCVRADVFKECYPKYDPSGYFLQNFALLSFNYSFNIKGYLPYFLPVVAGVGRYHHDSNTAQLIRFNRTMRKQYRAAIVKYGNEFLCGKRKHVFRDGQSKVIKTIEPNELKQYHQKVLEYRINRKVYLGKRRTGGLNYWIRRLKILLGYFFCQRRIYN